MSTKYAAVIFIFTLISCTTNADKSAPKVSKMPIVGTWKLVKAIMIEKGDSVVNDYSSKASFIKIINDTHFAFLQHDLNKGKDSTAGFSAGGGKYTLEDSIYTEHLEYCSAREWEGNNFPLTIHIYNDTLTQRGVEKVASAGVDRINIERYIRLK